MSLGVDGVWKAGVWATTVWADGVWFEGGVTPVVVPGATQGAGSGRYRDGKARRRFETDDDVLLYLEGLRAEFRALKAEAIHVVEVEEPETRREPEPALPPAVEPIAETIRADLELLERMEEERGSVASRLKLMERVINELEKMEAQIREEEEILLLH